MGLTSGGLGAKQSPRTRGFSGWGDIELGPSLPTPVSGDSVLVYGLRSQCVVSGLVCCRAIASLLSVIRLIVCFLSAARGAEHRLADLFVSELCDQRARAVLDDEFRGGSCCIAYL